HLACARVPPPVSGIHSPAEFDPRKDHEWDGYRSPRAPCDEGQAGHLIERAAERRTSPDGAPRLPAGFPPARLPGIFSNPPVELDRSAAEAAETSGPIGTRVDSSPPQKSAHPGCDRPISPHG